MSGDYVCNICGKQFLTKGGLSSHNCAVHNTVESPCTVCDKKFRNKNHLAVALFDMPNLNRFDILSISIFCKIALSISISISIFSKITISISISISIFLELPYRYRYRYRYFSELPYRYRYRYRYFSKVSIYRQSICHIDISNRAISNSRIPESYLLKPNLTVLSHFLYSPTHGKSQINNLCSL